MKKFTILLTALLLLLSLSSCRQDITSPPPEEEITTYAELFDAWWDKMNRYYVFWDLDSPGTEWDEVYSEYHPRFVSYGNIEMSDEETQSAVIDDFYEITASLSDGHYYMDLNLPGRESVRYQPGKTRLLTRLGLTPEEAKDAVLNGTSSDYEEFNTSAAKNEKAISIMKNIFGIDTDVQDEPLYREFSEKTAEEGRIGEYFAKAGYFITPESYVIKAGNESMDVGDFALFAGITEDGIAYLLFSGFMISPFVFSGTNEGNPVGLQVVALLESILDYISDSEDCTGAIIDIRGNGGGLITDLSLLWPAFIKEDVNIVQLRGKKTDNRQSYSSWRDLDIKANGSAEKNFDKPVAVLVNGLSASCSEMTTYFFKALRDNHGGNTYVIGDRTFGAHGPLDEDNPSDKYGSGSFHISSPYIIDDYIAFSNTPIYESRAYDGVIREGIGIDPDDSSIPFSITEFESGTDSRLTRAFDWIRTGI